MYSPIQVTDIELSHPLRDIGNLHGYCALKALVRLHGTPIGFVTLPVEEGRCTARALGRAIIKQQHYPIVRHLIRNGLREPLGRDGLKIENLLALQSPADDGPKPTVTVAVCTRDRTDDLSICLHSITCLDYPALDILVIDNAPNTNATQKLVQERFPSARYVLDPRPGLDWARNRAIEEARGEIIAFTDDDAVVDPLWIRPIAQLFAENDSVMAVTGMVIPYELETEAQILFEIYGGFGRGFEQKWYRFDHARGGEEIRHIGAGIFGTGANMAYRRSLFEKIGSFDTALDVGTVTNGGGDLEMFFRVLQEGYTLVYEPSAIVRHRHRREYADLRTQIANHGIGFYSFLYRSALAYADLRPSIVRFGLWWFWNWNIKRFLMSFLRPGSFPRDLILAELKGALIGLRRYPKARRNARMISENSGEPRRSDETIQGGRPQHITQEDLVAKDGKPFFEDKGPRS